MSQIPLVEREPQAAFARAGDKFITAGQFCADINAVAETLPDTRYLVNLCQERYTFTVCFFAALARGVTNLLPSRREPEFAQNLDAYEDLCVASDKEADGVDVCLNLNPGSNGSSTAPAQSGETLAAVAFTSGSTGEPQAHAKSWEMLDTWRRVHWRYLPGEPQEERGLVATVPSWHMYGLEWAMLLPTVAPLTLHCGPDFYPQDVATALTSFRKPSVLVSTPVHLRAMRKLPSPPANVSTVLSATAPLDDTLTREIENTLSAEIFEIYGCSEIGSLASRFPGEEIAWEFFDCFDVAYDEGAVTINHRTLPEPVTLADQFKQLDAARYELEGRNTDIIKVGGKRESLARLNNLLLGVDGVEDGVLYDPASYGLADSGRLAALVVAPGLNASDIRTALAREMDVAFLPRPIRFVDALPRDRTSKLRMADLASMIASESP